MPDPEKPGLVQGVVCGVQYFAEKVEMSLLDIMVETYDDYTGQIDFERVQGHPSEWYLDSK